MPSPNSWLGLLWTRYFNCLSSHCHHHSCWDQDKTCENVNETIEFLSSIITGWWFFATPLQNISKYESVSWDDEIPNIWKKETKYSKPPTVTNPMNCHSYGLRTLRSLQELGDICWTLDHQAWLHPTDFFRGFPWDFPAISIGFPWDFP